MKYICFKYSGLIHRKCILARKRLKIRDKEMEEVVSAGTYHGNIRKFLFRVWSGNPD